MSRRHGPSRRHSASDRHDDGNQVPPSELDWRRVGRLAGRVMSPGPAVGRIEAGGTVEGLRAAGARARVLAERASRLGPALDAVGRSDPAPILVVDRPGWARAAARSVANLAGPALAHQAGSTVQLATVLGVVGTRVLGQFDPYVEPRLLLVAPNIVEVGRAMDVDHDDFALWVCVHEQTHALQFAAAPWLADHLRDEARALLTSFGDGSRSDLDLTFEAVVAAVRGKGGTTSALDAVLDHDQRERLGALTAVMALLEGHADVTMDAVPIHAIRTKKALRAAMDSRRSSSRARIVNRLLGLDAKLAQYRDGAAFVRAVRRASPEALDVVWSEPRALPSAAEIAEPETWLRRVLP